MRSIAIAALVVHNLETERQVQAASKPSAAVRGGGQDSAYAALES